jgi:hypothetical protein
MNPVRSSILAIAVLLLVTAPALAESKASQCKRLGLAGEKLNSQYRTLTQQKGGDPGDRVGRTLKLLENWTQQMRAMQFEDPKLRSAQLHLVEIYEQGHDDIVDLYDANVRQDRVARQQALQKLDKLDGEQKILVKQVNQYCTVRPTR